MTKKSNHDDKNVDKLRRNLVKGITAVSAASMLPSVSAMTGKTRPTAVVIGAGIAGLSSAYDLRQAGFDVTIFEKEGFSGGRMREVNTMDGLNEGPVNGYTHALGLHGSYFEMFDFAEELGISDQLEITDMTIPLDNGHGVYPFTYHFRIPELQKIPGLSEETIRRLPSLQADLDKIRKEVNPSLLATGAHFDNETLGDYYERMLGKQGAKEILDYWINPILAGWGWRPYEFSKIGILTWFAHSDKKFSPPKGGIGALTRHLASLLPVQNYTTVRYITPADASGRHTIHYLTPDMQRRSITPDVVVSAVEGKYLPSLIQGMTPSQEDFFNRLLFTKEALLIYVFDEKKHSPSEFLIGAHTENHPDPYKRQVATWTVEPAMPEYGQPAVARCTLNRTETAKWRDSGISINEYCLPAMQQFYPPMKDKSIIKDFVNHSCDDLINLPVGNVHRMKAFLEEQESSKRGLYFTGEYLGAPSTGGACASGRSVANVIAKHWV